jgi:hypothetical protein
VSLEICPVFLTDSVPALTVTAPALPVSPEVESAAIPARAVEGPEFRTAPLTGIGRIGPPFLHDARVYLSKDTVDKTPAGTVTTNRDLTNAPLVVRSVDDAILAAIELHDLPAPDDKDTPKGGGCPVPPEMTNVDYRPSPKAVICPAYKSATSQTNRSDAREVIRRFRGLSSEDQQAVIEFLKQL